MTVKQDRTDLRTDATVEQDDRGQEFFKDRTRVFLGHE